MDGDNEKDRPSIDLDNLNISIDQEDCDEDLDLSQMDARSWLVKVPKFLSERWQKQAQMGGAGVELARMRVYEGSADGKERRRIEIILPTIKELERIPEKYTLDVRNQSSSNLYVFDELAKPEPVPTTSKPEPNPQTTSTSKTEKPRRVRPKVSRRPRVIGKIHHECLVSPSIGADYKAVLRARQQKASQPKRTIQRVDEDLATLNRMASGMTTQAQANKFATLTRTISKPNASEKFSRMPRTELLDALFAGFLRYQYWSMKSLRDQTKQPEAYLREVLGEIATLLKAGPYVGHWVLKPQYAELNRSKAAAKLAEAEAAAQAKAEAGEVESNNSPLKMDTDEPGDDDVNLDDVEDDEDDDDDDEMEEVVLG